MSDADSNDNGRPMTPDVAARACAAAPSDTRVSPEQSALHTLGQQTEQSKWQLPERFRLDKSNPDQKALLDQVASQQALWAQNVASPFGHASPEDQERARSVRIVEELRTVLADVDKRLSRRCRDAGMTEGLEYVQAAEQDKEIATLCADSLALRHQLAERYAIIGRYDLAAEIEPQAPYRDHYLQILEAIWREDDEQCDCSPHLGQGTQDFAVSQQFVAQDVWSIKHGCVTPLVKCNGCGHLNVRPMPAHLSKQRAHRARAQQLAGRLTPDEAARTLTQAGHTAARLLKVNRPA